MSKLNVDLDLVQKYNVPGPRYTSYPPAPQFTDQVTWPEVAAKIAQAQPSGRGLSLYFHIPFCESLCWYCGCTTVITTQREKGALYLRIPGQGNGADERPHQPQAQSGAIALGRRHADFLSPDEIRRLGESIRNGIFISRRTSRREWR
jgi:oxygen-independent coproporphyrinogen-3 oxidase